MSQSKGMVESKDTINSSLKKTTKKLLSLNSNKLAHAVSSKFKVLKELEKQGRNQPVNENSVSVNSIDVSITKRKVPKDPSDYSFDFGDKNKDITKSRTKIRFEDEQLSRIEELHHMHESIMSDNFKKDDSDSEIDNEEKKDNVLGLKAELDTKNLLGKNSRIDDSYDSETERRPHSANLAPLPPKTAMAKSQSLMNMELINLRPTSANVDNHSEMLDEKSVVGSMRSYMGMGQAKNYELLRVSKNYLSLISKQVKQVLKATVFSRMLVIDRFMERKIVSINFLYIFNILYLVHF